jgi:putative flippase GtrA
LTCNQGIPRGFPFFPRFFGQTPVLLDLPLHSEYNITEKEYVLPNLIQKLKEFIVHTATDPKARNTFIKYVVVGFSSAALEFSLLIVGVEVFKIEKWVANFIAYFIIFWFNYLLNRFWSFQSKDNIWRQLLMYGILFVLNIAIPNGILFNWLVYGQMWNYAVTKILVIGCVVSWNFVLYRTIIYRH